MCMVVIIDAETFGVWIYNKYVDQTAVYSPLLFIETFFFLSAISYQWYKNSIQSFIRPEVQAHTFISNNGKLYFSELASSDSGTYYCIVSLTTEGGRGNYIGSSQDVSRTSLGFSLVVKSGGKVFFVCSCLVIGRNL